MILFLLPIFIPLIIYLLFLTSTSDCIDWYFQNKITMIEVGILVLLFNSIEVPSNKKDSVALRLK